MPDVPKYRISPRAKRVWGKLQSWYGDALDQYGAFPPEDWCEVIDASTQQAEHAALAEMRKQHTTFPPRFPEFDALFTKAARPLAIDGPTPQERLKEFVIANRTLTMRQLAMPWTFLGQHFDAAPAHDPRHVWPGWGIRITGVVVPADGDHPGYRVMLEDMQLEQVA